MTGCSLRLRRIVEKGTTSSFAHSTDLFSAVAYKEHSKATRKEGRKDNRMKRKKERKATSCRVARSKAGVFVKIAN